MPEAVADRGKYSPPPVVAEAIARWDESTKHHDVFCRAYERGERAYRGVLSVSDTAAKWRHKYAPKYAFNLIETIVSSTIEQGLRMDIRPAPHCQVSLEEAQHMLYQAEAVSDALRHEHRVDQFEYKQRPLYLSAAISGIGILKPSWMYRTFNTSRQVVNPQPVHDEYGNKLLDVPVITTEEYQQVLDHSTTEVVDPRDFVMHESARELQPFAPGGAQYCFHRGWYSYEQLLAWERAEFVSNVSMLKETLDFSGEYADREQTLWNINRTKDLIEVLEYWVYKNGTVWRALIGNRMVLLRDLEANPFTHGCYPFELCSSMPQPFTVRAVSDIELVEELQAMLWETQNQSLDNMELINNWITLVRKDMDDLEQLEYYPGAIWEVEHPDQIKTLMPPYQLLDGTMNREATIRTDMQNVTSAAPFAGGTQLAAVQQNTATGASIVMNAAQQRLIAKKYQAQQGLKREAWQRIKLLQQFITDKRLLHILGPDGKYTFREIDPIQIQGEFIAELEPMGESNMRQERRAEALQWAQFLFTAAPLLAASGTPMNLLEVIKWAGKKWGIDDVERFISMNPAAMGAMAGLSGQGQGGPGGAPADPNMGITAGSAIDASKPSAAGGIGGSPVEAMSRALSMGGGANNV